MFPFSHTLCRFAMLWEYLTVMLPGVLSFTVLSEHFIMLLLLLGTLIAYMYYHYNSTYTPHHKYLINYGIFQVIAYFVNITIMYMYTLISTCTIIRLIETLHGCN